MDSRLRGNDEVHAQRTCHPRAGGDPVFSPFTRQREHWKMDSLPRLRGGDVRGNDVRGAMRTCHPREALAYTKITRWSIKVCKDIKAAPSYRLAVPEAALVKMTVWLGTVKLPIP